jgi:ABC-type methionine transport system ATPase subunit
MIVEWIVRLTYPQPLLDKPIIYHLIRQFDLLANIREAHVNTESGWLILSLRGEQEIIQLGIKWMTGQGVEVEVLSKGEETP